MTRRPARERPVGIYDIPLAEYVADPAPAPSASAGVLNTLIGLSPAHAWMKYRQDQVYRRDASLGTVFHAVFLGVGEDYEVLDPENYPGKKGGIPVGFTNDAIREARDAAMAAGKTPILRADFEAVEEMVAAAERQLAAHPIGDFRQRAGKGEQTMLWREGDTWCRACADWLPADPEAEPHGPAIYNLKTAACAHPDLWAQRVLWTSGHDLSAAHYTAGIAATLGIEVAERFVVVERRPPYALSVIDLSPGSLALAERRRRTAVEWWGRCVESGRWPAYPAAVCTVTTPPWIEARQTEKELSGHYEPEMLDNLVEAFAP